MERLHDTRIDGRITVDAVTEFARGLERFLDTDGPFAVVFDRRSMTAPTPEGRRALEEWGAATVPRLGGRCVAWADVLDQRRATSLDRAGSADRANVAYPQRTFTDPGEARRWAEAALRDEP